MSRALWLSALSPPTITNIFVFLPAGCVAEGVAGGLAERPALGLQFLAGVAVVVPGSRKLAVLVADFLQPGFAVGDQAAADRPRHADPFAVNIVDDPRQVVIAALLLAD